MVWLLFTGYGDSAMRHGLEGCLAFAAVDVLLVLCLWVIVVRWRGTGFGYDGRTHFCRMILVLSSLMVRFDDDKSVL